MENKKPETTKERAIKLGLIPAPTKDMKTEKEIPLIEKEIEARNAKAKKK